MASGFVEAIMAQAIAASDPQVKIAKEYLDAQVDTMRQDLFEKKLQTLGLIRVELAKAKAEDASASVIDSYERLLVAAGA